MSRKGYRLNRAGYTLVEVMIASLLICVLAAGAMTGFRHVSQLNQRAQTRTAHTEMRTRVFEALSDSGNCAENLAYLSVPNAMAPPASVLVPSISQILFGGPPDPFLINGAKVEGLQYSLALRFPGTGYSESFKAGYGRANTTYRHNVLLEVTGHRYILGENNGAKIPVLALIPLSAEFDSSTNRLVSCTLNPEEIDERLGFGSAHTVRECLAYDGVPYPTPEGMLCRFPVTTPNAPGYSGAIPSCGSVAPGWSNAVASGPNYNTTVSRDAQIRKCKGTAKEVTGWHYMSRQAVEHNSFKVKKGEGKNFSWMAAGASYVVGAIVAIGIIGLAIFAIIAIFMSKCKSETFHLYAQVNGVGCI